MKMVVSKTLLLFPDKIVHFVTKNCWFVGSFDDGWGFTLKGEELGKGECLIFLSDELLNQNEEQIRYTIVHEIGHVILGHRNSIGKVQSKKEVRRQEKEAHEFSNYYLNLG